MNNNEAPLNYETVNEISEYLRLDSKRYEAGDE